ncbi:MAG TPA: DNA-processing protein DprA, partial [Labilithrix sp.]
GRDHLSPKQNQDLFARVARAPRSAMIWPFRDDVGCDKRTPRARNGVLVALADEVVVVQAKIKSGSRNAASWARSLGRPLWVLPGPECVAFAGSALELARGARPLAAPPELFHAPPNAPSELIKEGPSEVLPDTSWSDREKLVFSMLSDAPRHIDDLASETASGVGAVVTTLLTLSLKNVVVEGPDGFFRRRSAG